MTGQGVDPETLTRRMRAEILWSRAVARKYLRLVQITDSEIDEAVALAEAARNEPRDRLSEILLRRDRAKSLDDLRQRAEELRRQLRDGANFADLARQYSEAPSAEAGGAVGWIPRGRLPPILESAVADLKIGEVSAPLETPLGIQLLRLDDRQTNVAANPLNDRVTLAQVFCTERHRHRNRPSHRPADRPRVTTGHLLRRPAPAGQGDQLTGRARSWHHGDRRPGAEAAPTGFCPWRSTRQPRRSRWPMVSWC